MRRNKECSKQGLPCEETRLCFKCSNSPNLERGSCRVDAPYILKITGLDSPRELRSSVSRGSDSPPDCHSLPLPFLPLISPKTKSRPQGSAFHFGSGLRGSNPPPPPWQGGALPNELNPQVLNWRLGWGSNPRPLA